MKARPFVWAGCGETASARIEVYVTAGLGSLVAVVYACEPHARHAIASVEVAGYAPRRTGAVLRSPRACGYVYRFPTAGGAR
ncbi:hypothetical protein [Micromonospora orduensis]|uniref:hypothetical protein n=1 Tax=Micromonospora orduensis TaxID=1420891 RepID=UPI0036447622